MNDILLFRRVTVAVAAAAAVIVAGLGADAAHRHRHAIRHPIQRFAERCNDPAYYSEYSRWCQAAFHVAHPKAAQPMFTKEYGAVGQERFQLGADTVTIKRDLQANTTDVPRTDPVIIMQTGDDVANSPPRTKLWSPPGGFPSSLFLDWKHVPVYAEATPRERHVERHEVITRTTTTTTRRYVEPAGDLSHR
jgi:hypothetical protein